MAEDMGVKYDTVRKWEERNFIPATAWKRLVEKALERGYDVNYKMLVDMAAEK